MTKYVHGGHAWVCMGAGGHDWGWGHGQETKRGTGTYISLCDTTTVRQKQEKDMLCCGGARIVTRNKPGHTRHVKRPIKT